MYNLLIVTDSFTPDFSPRVSFLVKNLIKDGHSVTVLTEDVENPFYEIDIQGVSICRVGFYKSKPHTVFRKFEWAFKAFLNLCFDYKSSFFLKKWSSVASGYDAVICSTFSYFPLKPAYKLAGRLGVPFIADIRDLSEQFTGREYQLHNVPLFSKWFERVQCGRRNYYLKEADVLTTVSPWHQQFLKKFNDNVCLIYNGYDESFCFSETKSDTFDIVYTGKWLGVEMQDPTMLFNVLEKLIGSGTLPQDKVRVVWYLSKGTNALNELLARYPISRKISKFADRVPYSDIPSVLQKSSIVLVLTNKFSEKGPKGIITTKFFEGLGCEKPILNIISDGSYLANLINETNAGLSTDNAATVEEFLLSEYRQWSATGCTHQIVNKTAKRTFDRACQAKQFEAIIETLNSKGK